MSHQIRKVRSNELYYAYQCPCGFTGPTSQEFAHKVKCKHSQSNSGRRITIPDPRLFLIQSSRGPLVIDGLQTSEELAAIGPSPFTPVEPEHAAAVLGTTPPVQS